MGRQNTIVERDGDKVNYELEMNITDSLLLRDEIIRRIAAHPYKAISFRDYMELCLYHPSYGYYMREQMKIGKQGDFYTSASIGSVMGDMIADMALRYFENSTSREMLTLVEWGGGDGRLAEQVLSRIQAMNEAMVDRMELIMIEHSPHHRALQQQRLAGRRVRWMDEAEWRRAGPWRDVYVWANELLDAFPIHRIKLLNGEIQEVWVGWDEQRECFIELFKPPTEDVMEYIVRHQLRLVEEQLGEINLAAESWIQQLAMNIEGGAITLIDYGDEADEIYAPHRKLGTLMCYRRHQASDDPYRHVGDQDMTSHVNFTSCMQAAEEAGFTEIKLETQAEYLVRGGVLQWLQEHHDPDPFSLAARRNRAIRQLLLSDQMSELFKVMTAYKHAVQA